MTQVYPLARELHGIHFCLLAPLESSQARFAFTGRRPPWMAEVRSAQPSLRGQTQEQFSRFQNQEIVWDTTLLTLAHYHAEQPESARPTVRTAFLEIGGETARGRAIRVALDIPHINEPAILRTIIMIRNYKRLYSGRHEFGEPRTFPPR